jgi:hypothetical protein
MFKSSRSVPTKLDPSPVTLDRDPVKLDPSPVSLTKVRPKPLYQTTLHYSTLHYLTVVWMLEYLRPPKLSSTKSSHTTDTTYFIHTTTD